MCVGLRIWLGIAAIAAAVGCSSSEQPIAPGEGVVSNPTGFIVRVTDNVAGGSGRPLASMFVAGQSAALEGDASASSPHARYAALGASVVTLVQQLNEGRLSQTAPWVVTDDGTGSMTAVSVSPDGSGRFADAGIVRGSDTVRVHFDPLTQGGGQILVTRGRNGAYNTMTFSARRGVWGASVTAAVGGDYSSYNADPCHDAIVDYNLAVGALLAAGVAVAVTGPVAVPAYASAAAYVLVMENRGQNACNGFMFSHGTGGSYMFSHGAGGSWPP